MDLLTQLKKHFSASDATFIFEAVQHSTKSPEFEKLVGEFGVGILKKLIAPEPIPKFEIVTPKCTCSHAKAIHSHVLPRR